jgi:hypothetical protein
MEQPMNHFKLALGISGLLAAFGAHAATQTVQGSFSLPTTSTTTSLVQNFNVAAFDTSLGTLTGVSISFASGSTASVQGSGYVAAVGTGTFTDTSTASFILLDGATSLIDSGIISNMYIGSMAAAGVTTNPAGTSVSLNGLSPYVLSTGLGSFSGGAGSQTAYTVEFLGTGTGALPGSITSAGGLTNGSTGTIFVGGSAAANGTLDVTYTYTASVPEPSTYALMLGGLGLAGFAARRRKAE